MILTNGNLPPSSQLELLIVDSVRWKNCSHQRRALSRSFDGRPKQLNSHTVKRVELTQPTWTSSTTLFYMHLKTIVLRNHIYFQYILGKGRLRAIPYEGFAHYAIGRKMCAGMSALDNGRMLELAKQTALHYKVNNKVCTFRQSGSLIALEQGLPKKKMARVVSLPAS